MNSRDQNPTETSRGPGNLTFSQANGYEEIPGPLNLEELPQEARTHIWNAFYLHLPDPETFGQTLSTTWYDILYRMHVHHDNLPIDNWDGGLEHINRNLRHRIGTSPINKVFDLLQFVMRQPKCPPDFIKTMKGVFATFRLAYVIDGEDPTEDKHPPTILPAVTQEEGNAVLESLETLRGAGLNGGTKHLREASKCINQCDWVGSVRESIHAVESVARKIAPEANTLKPALVVIEKKHGALHPALKKAFEKLYGYTSNEGGVRHSRLDGKEAKVGMDEAVFMLGACASFASYLWRKHQAYNSA